MNSTSILSILAGTWFVLGSNFPMWLKGTKTHPTFTYTIAEKHHQTGLRDVVSYRKNGKSKTIKGFDFPNEHNPMAFTWRGNGLLFIAKSNWEVRLLDDEQQWAVIYFSKTLFTPEGVDIISRSSTLDSLTLAHIHEKMAADTLLKKHLSSVRTIQQ